MNITDEHRARYIAARKALAEAETGVADQIKAIEAGAGIPALREAFDEIQDVTGEAHATCEGCGTPLFDEDDYSTDEDGDVYACAACIERWGGAGWAERDDVEECAKAYDARKPAGAPR